MSSRAAGSVGQSSNSQRRHRSRSTSRYADLEKPKKKKTLSATTSLVSIPNTIKLSMLNSGLLSFEKIKLEARDENNSLSQTIPDKPIELRHFVKLCEQRRKFPVLYKLEFQTAVKVETNTCRHALRKNNLDKNQNQKCIPYDYNRVVLEKIPNVPDSDYINASYVDSLLKPNAYIVTQGPTEETVNEFWRMVWQENVSAIVMLTKTFDFTKVMCVQYWPPNDEVHETYGDIHINIVKEEQLANFQIRTFRLYKKNLDDIITEERLILQFHYTEWHSHTCPFSNAVLEFRRRVRAVVGNVIKPGSMVGPMLVHCNDGGGRSGVYLAIDANLELAEEEDCFHVFGYLKKLRQSRKGLIENVDQYKFVYDTLEEHIICGKTWFPVTELSERLKQKAKRDLITKMNEYQKEYAQICKQTPRFTIGDCAGGHRADNREKNRDVLCVPPDNFRPYLTSFQGNAFTDYINSVFVDGYTKPREYIVTEWPLKHTLGEFWSLVYDHECSAVVVLCQPPANSQQFPSFWPQKSKMEKYGPVFSVHFASGKHYQNIKQWEFKINKKIISLTEMMAGVKAPTKTVQLFQLTCWPMGHKVPTSTNSLVFLMNMVELWRQKTDYGPVCVVSPDGRSRAGVYCAANACIEQVVQHGEVDVFQAVKTVRRHRPQLVDNMTEYKYCYDLVLHYVLHFLDKEHKEKKFIAFGRGKHIPLTPDNQNSELPLEISNTGRVIVKKCIDKIDKREALIEQQQLQHQTQQKHLQEQHQLMQKERQLYRRNNTVDRNGKIIERKSKGRLYSVGGNEPLIRKGCRGRLDRLKTVGTFDLGTEISVLSEVARNLNERLISGEMGTAICSSPGDQSASIKYPTTSSTTPTTTLSVQSTSVRNTPESNKKHLNKSISSIRTTSDGRGVIFLHKGPIPGDVGSIREQEMRGVSSNICYAGVQTQHSADDCVQRKFHFDAEHKSRSLSTSGFLSREKTNEWPISTQQLYQQKQQQQQMMLDEDGMKGEKQKSLRSNKAPGRASSEDGVITSSLMASTTAPTTVTPMTKSVDFSKSSTETSTSGAGENKKEFSYMKRKSMLRKSKRIIRTDSEIFREGIVDSSTGTIEETDTVMLQNNADIQVNLKSTKTLEDQQHVPRPSQTVRNLALLSQEYADRNDSVTSSSIFSRKNSSDFDDLCSPKEYQYRQSTTTTDESSKNQSTDDLDAVFSDSTTDLEQLEKEYKELMKSNLQREYKSDGDTLDEIGKRKKREDFGKWKNQSLEHDFGEVVTTVDITSSSKVDVSLTATRSLATPTTAELKMVDNSINIVYSNTSTDLTKNKDTSGIYSPENGAVSANSDSGVVKGFVDTRVNSDVDNLNARALTESNMRLRVYSSSRVGETPVEKERLSYPSSRYFHHYRDHDLSDIDDVAIVSPSRSHRYYQYSQSVSIYSDSDAGDELLRLQKVTSRPSILKIDQSTIKQKNQQHQQKKSTKSQELEQDTGTQKCSSIFDNPLSKFRKVNKLLKCKRFSASALYEKKLPIETTITDAVTKIVLSGTSTPTSTKTIKTVSERSKSDMKDSSSKGSPIKPLKKKRAIHLSKLSLFSQKPRKQSGISYSSHELASKSSSKAKLSETSKSTCEISSKFKSSPLKFSRKSSKRDKSLTKSIDPQKHQATCHSPLSEEFYNKTGSVRLSAIELYEKFCSEDFGGLYKHETDDQRLSFGSGDNQHEYRLEKKGLRTIGRYNKNAKLLKQKSEPKFYYLSTSHPATDTYYHEEEEYYYDSQPEDHYYYPDSHYCGPYYNEQDEYYDEYEDEEDGFEGDYYEDEDDDRICYGDERPAMTLDTVDISGYRKADNEDEDDRELVSGGAVGMGVASSLMSVGGIVGIVGDRFTDVMKVRGSGEIVTDSDVDEIFLMPSEDSKCSGSDYEEYGFENKQFTLEQTMLKSTLDIENANGNANKEIKSKTSHHNRHGDDSIACKTTDDVLTIYKICSREYLDQKYGAFKKIPYSSTSSMQKEEFHEIRKSTENVEDKRLKDDIEGIDDDDDGLQDDTTTSNKKYRSLSLHCGESLQKVVSDYVKLSTTSLDQHISPHQPSPGRIVTNQSISTTVITENTSSAVIATIKTDCLDTSDKTDNGSLELLSTNSSSGGTIRSHSTLTEYAFDTVKNLNLDSCSTNSKLSLSLKSEIFDDFTITPDELKPINKCDIEDFTLTPDGSMSDEKQLQFKIETEINVEKNITESDKYADNGKCDEDNGNVDTDKNRSSPPPPPSLIDDNELDDNVLLIVNEFLANERNLPRAGGIDNAQISSDIPFETDEQKTDELTYEPIQSKIVESTNTNTTNNIIPKEYYKTENISDTLKQCVSNLSNNTISDVLNRKSNLVKLHSTSKSSSSSNNKDNDDDVDVDNENHNYNEQDISLFTSELTKEFDQLFSNAEKFNENISDEQQQCKEISDRYNNDNDKKREDYNTNKHFKEDSDKLSQNTIITKSKTTMKSDMIDDNVDENTDHNVKGDNNDDDRNNYSDKSSYIKLRKIADIPTRYSMQKLEPIEFFDWNIKNDDKTDQEKCSGTKLKLSSSLSSPLVAMPTIKTTSITTKNTISTDTTLTKISTTSSSSQQHQSSSQQSTNNKKLQKQNRSQSLGNLNKKTKCFPL